MIKPPQPIIPIQINSESSIAAEGNFYFLEYLEFKLFRFNLNSFIRFERDDEEIPQRFQETAEKVQEICALLEHLYPKLYVYISRQLKVTLQTEIIICDIFRSFGRTLFKSGITWPRIVALFAFASGLIVDCIREGRPEFARTVVYCVKAFIEDNLSVWVKDQGGWVCLNIVIKIQALAISNKVKMTILALSIPIKSPLKVFVVMSVELSTTFIQLYLVDKLFKESTSLLSKNCRLCLIKACKH